MYHNTTGRPIYVNSDKTKVVKEDSPAAAFLLVGIDGELPDEEAARYGLHNAPVRAVPDEGAEAKAVPAPPATKAMPGPMPPAGRAR